MSKCSIFEGKKCHTTDPIKDHIIRYTLYYLSCRLREQNIISVACCSVGIKPSGLFIIVILSLSLYYNYSRLQKSHGSLFIGNSLYSCSINTYIARVGGQRRRA